MRRSRTGSGCSLFDEIYPPSNPASTQTHLRTRLIAQAQVLYESASGRLALDLLCGIVRMNTSPPSSTALILAKTFPCFLTFPKADTWIGECGEAGEGFRRCSGRFECSSGQMRNRLD